MSFLDEIKEIETNRNDRENVVIDDILNYFKDKLYSDNFKNNLKDNYIKRAINNGKDYCELMIEFWEYHSGCSNTYISVGGCGRFELKNDSSDSPYNYKGIRLYDIHKRICSKLSDLLKTRLSELGLQVVATEREDDKFRFDYYKERIKIKWR